MIEIRYDFKFVDDSLLDDFEKVKNEIKGFKQPSASLVGTEIVIHNGTNSLQEYWQKNYKDKK